MDKIKVNGILYECFSYYLDPENSIVATLKTDNTSEVKENFLTSKSIVIINAIGQIVKTLEGYSIYKGISELPNYYVDNEGVLRSAIQISMSPVDITERVRLLEDKVSETVNEADMTLEEYKAYRITQSKIELEKYLESHPITSTAHGGVEGTYSITKEKQDLMSQQYLTYRIAKQARPDKAVLTWNEAGGVCTEWTEEEFVQLIIEIKAKIYPLVSYQQAVEVKIRESNDKAVIAAIIFDYDNPVVESDEVDEEATA